LIRVSLLGSYSPVWEAAMLDGFQKLVDDGIQHIEMRGIQKPYGGQLLYGNTSVVIAKYLDLLKRKYIPKVQHSFVRSMIITQFLTLFLALVIISSKYILITS